MKTNNLKKMTNPVLALLILLCGTVALIHYSEWPGLAGSLGFALIPILINV